jgi:hypothetical protein
MNRQITCSTICGYKVCPLRIGGSRVTTTNVCGWLDCINTEQAHINSDQDTITENRTDQLIEGNHKSMI